ncbi:MAG: phage tail protein I [Candidatus Adiutrix sp.]|jgi:phage tail P2-like protein|nr:phage tail protein I [Candidatus Adiutrix sp.]
MPEPTPPIWPAGRGKLLGQASLPELLPSSIGYDQAVQSVARAIEGEIELFVNKIPTVLLWPAISVLEEPILTHLGFMLHVDWWDEAWNLEAKRQFLFRQSLLHRRKGTAWAVEEAVSLVYGPARLREWFEYGGPPGCFLIDLEILESGLSQDDVNKIVWMIGKYKRKSQHICGLTFSAVTSGPVYLGATLETEAMIDIWPYMPDSVELSDSALYLAASVEADHDLTV